jgi:hypothetical protein
MFVCARLPPTVCELFYENTNEWKSEEGSIQFINLTASGLRMIEDLSQTSQQPNPYVRFIAPFFSEKKKWKTEVQKQVLR